MQTSGREQKAPLRPHEGGEPASLTPRGPLTRRWLEVLGWRADLLPFQPRHSRCPTRAAPLEARERAARTAREEDGGGAYREPRREGRGRRQGLEAKTAREGLPGVGARDSSSSRIPLAHSLHTRGSSSVPAREGQRRGAVLVTPGKSPDKGKPRPHSAGPAPPPPLLSNPRDVSPAQGRTQKGRPRLPHYQPVVARATRGPICR